MGLDPGKSGKLYRLVGADGREYLSATPGTLAGNRYGRYGRLDCPAALEALSRGGSYRAARVFFADAKTAAAAGYRPCGACLPEAYRAWREQQAREDRG
jgi:hypothetical protein